MPSENLLWSTTFAATCIVGSAIIAAVTPDHTSQAVAPSMVCSNVKLEVGASNVVFSDKSRFCLQLHHGRICVWGNRKGGTLLACIRHRHTTRSPGVLKECLPFPFLCVWVVVLSLFIYSKRLNYRRPNESISS